MKYRSQVWAVQLPRLPGQLDTSDLSEKLLPNDPVSVGKAFSVRAVVDPVSFPF